MTIIKSFIALLLFSPFLYRLDTFQNKSDDALVLNKKNFVVGQTFVARHNGIYMIKINTNNPKLAYKLPMTFSLKRSVLDTQSIFSLNFNGSNIGSNYLLPLKFPPQNDSQNKSYYFEISSASVSPDAVLEFSHLKKDVYQNGSAYLNGQQINGDLAFKIYYKTTLRGFISDIFKELSDRLSEDVWFMVVYASIIVLLLISTFYVFTKNQ